MNLARQPSPESTEMIKAFLDHGNWNQQWPTNQSVDDLVLQVSTSDTMLQHILEKCIEYQHNTRVNHVWEDLFRQAMLERKAKRVLSPILPKRWIARFL